MNHKTAKQKVLEILKLAMYDHQMYHSGYIFFEGQQINVRDGFVPQSVFANPTVTGSTEGKRRLRDLRQELANKYLFEKRHKKLNGKSIWEYRILPRINHELRGS